MIIKKSWVLDSIDEATHALDGADFNALLIPSEKEEIKKTIELLKAKRRLALELFGKEEYTDI